MSPWESFFPSRISRRRSPMIMGYCCIQVWSEQVPPFYPCSFLLPCIGRPNQANFYATHRRICRSLIFSRLAASLCVSCLRLTSCSTRSRSRSRWLKAIRSVSMRPSGTYESGHFYFAQIGHSHFAATDCEAKLKFGAGQTYDFAFRPEKSGKLELQTSFIELHTNVPITVLEGKEAVAHRR